MSNCCTGSCAPSTPPADRRYRRILWIALLVNALMFLVELAAGWSSGSVSLLADAVDFFGDAANYGVALFVLALAPAWRARAAWGKGVTMGLYGLFVLGATAWHLAAGTVPEASTMGLVGFAALAANLLVAALLYAYRDGDANMRAVWLCTRNDAIGNVAVMAAALGVSATGAGWPDLAVAAIMGVLGVSAARSVIGQARRELAAAPKLGTAA